MSQVAAQLLITPTREHLVDGLGLRMQYGNRTGHPQWPLLSTGGAGFKPVSSNASLNQPVNHCRITAGKCVNVETVRPECRQTPGAGNARQAATEPKSPDQQQFSSRELAGQPRSGAVSVIHLMKTEQLVVDNIRYSTNWAGPRRARVDTIQTRRAHDARRRVPIMPNYVALRH